MTLVDLLNKLLSAIPVILVEERKRRYPKASEFANRLGVPRQRLPGIEQSFLRGGDKPGFEWATLLRYARALESEEEIVVEEDEK